MPFGQRHSIDTDAISVNNDEISAVKTITIESLMKDIKKNKQKYTPWLIIAMGRMDQLKLKLPETFIPETNIASAVKP